jgi:hypothetical protein
MRPVALITQSQRVVKVICSTVRPVNNMVPVQRVAIFAVATSPSIATKYFI